MEKSNQILFRKIRGHIVPIRVGAGSSRTALVGSRIARKAPAKGQGPDRALQAAAVGVSVASGVMSAMPMPGRLGFWASQIGSLVVDSGATALNAASVRHLKKDRLKEFGKAELRSTAIGYGVWGGLLLGLRKNRRAIGKWSANTARGLKRLAWRTVL